MNIEESILIFVFCVLFIPNTVFNALVCLVVKRTKSLQTPINNLIMNLALCDILIGVFILPRHVFLYMFSHPEGTAGDCLCKLVTSGGFLWTSVTSSGLILTIVAFERYFAVVRPYKSRLRITKKKLKWIVPLVWVFSIASNLPSMLAMEYSKERNFCIETWVHWVSPKAYASVMFVIGTSSVVFMYVLYSVILFKFWKKRKSVTEMTQAARLRARTKVTRMLILMTIIHTLCRTPNYAFYLLSYIEPQAQYGSAAYSLTVALILLNSTSHPFLLCWQMKTFRDGVAQILQGIICQSRLRSLVFSDLYQVHRTRR